MWMAAYGGMGAAGGLLLLISFLVYMSVTDDTKNNGAYSLLAFLWGLPSMIVGGAVGLLYFYFQYVL